MSEVSFLLLFVPLSLFLAVRVADCKADGRYLLLAVILAWLVLGLLVGLLNQWMPFADGGDDWDYYHLADSPITRFSEVFDFSRFAGQMEQPGYPWVLSIIRTVFGHELLIYKWLNLFFLIVLSLVWYRIGVRLESPWFGRSVAIMVLLFFPLWFYVFFVLKDMAIVLLQSVAVWGMVELWHGNRRSSFAARFVLPSFLLLLFRSALIAQNAGVLLGTLVLRQMGRGTGKSGGFSVLFMTLVLVIVAVPIVTSSATMSLLGIHSEHRVLGSAEMYEQALLTGESSEVKWSLFLLIYLFSEIAGLNASAWVELDSFWLRGVLALPWIFLQAPFFLLGIVFVFRSPSSVQIASGYSGHWRDSRVMTSGWGVVFLFIASSFAISWIVGDATRWRLPDMPMLAATTLLGWAYSPASMRQLLLFAWIAAAGVLFSLYYLLRA